MALRSSGARNNNFVSGDYIGVSADGATLYDGGYDEQVDSGASDNAVQDDAMPPWVLTSGVPTTTQSVTGTPPRCFDLIREVALGIGRDH